MPILPQFLRGRVGPHDFRPSRILRRGNRHGNHHQQWGLLHGHRQLGPGKHSLEPCFEPGLRHQRGGRHSGDCHRQRKHCEPGQRGNGSGLRLLGLDLHRRLANGQLPQRFVQRIPFDGREFRFRNPLPPGSGFPSGFRALRGRRDGSSRISESKPVAPNLVDRLSCEPAKPLSPISVAFFRNQEQAWRSPASCAR